MNLCLFNTWKEIKNVNKFLLITYFSFSFLAMCISRLCGGRPYLYRCLRLPILAINSYSYLPLIIMLCLLSSLSISIYVSRSCNCAVLKKLKINIVYISYIILCATWYPTFFGLQRFSSALIILFCVMLVGFWCIKIYSQKSFAAAFVMFWTQIIIIYMFFLQLCINILN